VLPLLYLHGLSSKDFVPALGGFLGADAGLSAATVTRLTVQWQDEARAFNERDLSNVDFVYVERRHPRQHPPGRGEAVSARARRRAG
jgi:hypothetical protein